MGLVVPCVFFGFFSLPASEEVDLSDDALLLLVLLKSVTSVGGVACGVVFEALCSCTLVFCLLIVFWIHAGATKAHGIVLALESQGVGEIVTPSF